MREEEGEERQGEEIEEEQRDLEEGPREEIIREDRPGQNIHWYPIERQNMFSDAVFSIIGTIVIANFIMDEDQLTQEDFLLKPALLDHIPQFVAYFGCFFIVSMYWGCHVRLYNVVIRSNDVLTWLNLLLLCVLSFFPLTVSLWSMTQSYNSSMTHLPAANIIMVAFVLIVTIFYVFREKSAHYCNIESHLKREKRLVLLIRALFPSLLSLICVYTYKLQEMALCVIFITIILATFVIAKFEQWYIGRNLIQITIDYAQKELPIDRIEAFSDGVYAISMTLMAVTISEKLVQFKDSDNFILLFANAGLAYCTSFTATAILWFVHHQLFANIKHSNSVIQTLNTLAVAFVGGVPFTSSLIQHYVNPSNYNEKNFNINEMVAVQFHCMVLFTSGFWQAIMWLAALFMNCTTVGFRDHADTLLFIKAMTLPVLSTIVFLSSLYTKYCAFLLAVLMALVPFAFSACNYVQRGRICPWAQSLIVNVFGPSTGPVSQGLMDERSDYDRLEASRGPHFSYLPDRDDR